MAVVCSKVKDKMDDILGNPEIGNSSKTFWQVMGRFKGKTGTSINIPPLHKQDNTLAFSDFEKAQDLNSYFASISTIDDTNTDLPYFEKRCNVVFTQMRITESEVVDVLKILKLNKATGPDGISNRMLKLTHSTVSYPLTKLFNLSLKTHTYPYLWEIAHVMPLFKKGEKSFCCNNRPVSLTSNVGKSFNELFSSICTITFLKMNYYININQGYCLVILVCTI